MNNKDFVKESNKEICLGYGCNRKATEKIEVDAGTFGNIVLNLCSICVRKFR